MYVDTNTHSTAECVDYRNITLYLSVVSTTGNVCICVHVCMYVHIIPVPIVHVYNDTSAFMEYWG